MQQLKGLKNEAHFCPAHLCLRCIIEIRQWIAHRCAPYRRCGKSIAPAKFSSVDFPQPLRPTSATNSPSRHIQRDAIQCAHGLAIGYVFFVTDCRERIAMRRIARRSAATSARQAPFRLRNDFLRVRLNLRIKPRNHFAIRANQKFCEVPADLAAGLGIRGSCPSGTHKAA